MENKFLAAAFTLTGTIIGAGILGLPYVFSRSGFFVGVFWLILLGLILIYVNLAFGEVVLCTKRDHQLPGYAEKYLGKWGRKLMIFALFFGIYSALIAYLIGEGQSFSMFFTNGTKYAVYFAVGFWVAMTLLLRKGLKGLKKIETRGVFAIIFLIILVFVWLVGGVSFGNLETVSFNLADFIYPFGIVLFALMGFTSIPEMRQVIRGQEKLLKKAIVFGASIPIVLYLMFAFVFVGVLGENIKEVATISFVGPLGTILILLGIFTMMTSYFVLSFVLKDYFIYDLNKSNWSFFFVSIVPLILYFGIVYLGFTSFVGVLGIGGGISAGLTGILIILMNFKSKKKRDRKPEFSVSMNLGIIVVLSLIFLFGVIIQFIF